MVQLIEGASVVCQDYRSSGKRLFGRISYIKEEIAFVKVLKFTGEIEFAKLHSIPLSNLTAVDTRKSKIKLIEKKKLRLQKKEIQAKKNALTQIPTTNSGIDIVSSEATKPDNKWIGLGGSEAWFESGVYRVETGKWYQQGKIPTA